jgi:prepilin-type N-terminal cleavage/methylation domain-containing protein
MERICRHNGYTLIETMVVMAIMGIMLVVIGPSYASYQRGKSLSYARTLIINEVRYVQDSTLSGMKTKFSGTMTTPKGGYGMYFQNGATSMIIFGDLDADGVYDSSNEFVETVNLTSGVRISDLNVGSSTAAVSYVCVPPYAKGIINTLSGATLTITLQSTKDSAALGYVSIGSSGYTN